MFVFFFKKNYVELLLKLIILDMLSEFCDRLFLFILQCPGLKTEEMSRQKRLRELICIASINEECWELLAKIQKKKPSQGLYVYNNIVNKDSFWVKAALQDVIEGKMSIAELSKRAKDVPAGESPASQRLRKKR